MKRMLFLSLIFLISTVCSFAQGLELNDKLPNDPKVIIGTLNNGMKYYIRSNSIPEKRAEFTLVINAGSVLEDEDQQGLAHFVEHMAFNGSKNFPKNELVDYLESLGMKFGPEVNAYTSLDETVYGIKVPTDSAEYINKGLLVLYDWASQLLLDTDAINAERGIIHEEWRMSQGAMDRMQEKYIKTILYNSKYAERMPIGKMNVVDNCDPEALRRFYKDWYRPDLMAVVIVGDFDAKEMEKKVQELFGQIKANENPRKRDFIEVPDHDNTLIEIASDPESPISMVQLIYKHPMEQVTTVADYRNDLIEALLSTMMVKRMQELTMAENPPFSYGVSAISELIGPKKVYMSVGIVSNNDIKNAVDALVTENQRMIQYGFTATELEREKASVLKMIEKQYNERDKQKSENYVEEYKNNYLFPYSPFPGIEYEYELSKKYIPTISLDEVNSLAKTLVTEKNAVIVVMTPEKEGIVVPTQEEILKVYNEAGKKKIEPYVDKVSDKPLISNLPPKGKVSKVAKNKELDYEVWTLKNGIKVVIKTTNFKDDEILFFAKSKGGYSVYDQKDDVSAKIASAVALESGLGDFDFVELQKYLSDKNARVSSFIGEVSEGVSGNSSVADFEVLLQLIHTSFMKPKVSESSFKSYINKESGLLENAKLSPETIWQDSAQWILANYSPRKRPMSAELLKEADFKRVRYIYNQRFSDPTNFTFYFVGNIDKKIAKSLIEQYIGSLPVVERKENFVDLGIRAPKGKIEKVVRKGKDAKCMETIVFHGEMNYNVQNRLELDAICKILSTRLLEDIREKESGVYTIGAYPSSFGEPYGGYKITIFFSCDPDREDELSAKIFEIIKSLQADGLNSVDIQKVVEKEKREFETDSKENSYWRRVIVEVEEGTMTADDYKKYNENINAINIENMKAAANKYLDLNNYVKVYLMPEE